MRDDTHDTDTAHDGVEWQLVKRDGPASVAVGADAEGVKVGVGDGEGVGFSAVGANLGGINGLVHGGPPQERPLVYAWGLGMSGEYGGQGARWAYTDAG